MSKWEVGTMKQLNVLFEDSDHAALKEVKGDRPWREAILEEFGVVERGESDE